MRSAVRRRLEMAAAVRQFSRDHPSDDPSYAIMLGKLEELVTRAEALAAQEIGGRIAELAAGGRRDELRRSIHFQLLRHLIKSGELAAKERPELLGKFRIRSLRAPHTSYLISARKMLEEGIANKDLLASVGLSTAMLDELGSTIAQFEAATAEVRTGKIGHVGARAELEAVTAEILDRVGQLNTFNQHRFRSDPEKLAGWEAVRNVPGAFRSNTKPVVEGGVTPPSGAVAPAA
jgi:hypothetical protein